MATHTRFPTTYSAIGSPSWTLPTRLYADDGLYAQAADQAQEKWGGFGFDALIGLTEGIVSVSLEIQVWKTTSDAITLVWVIPTISGQSIAAHAITITETAHGAGAIATVDLTADKSWTRADLLNAALKIVLLADTAVAGQYIRADYLTITVETGTIIGGSGYCLAHAVCSAAAIVDCNIGGSCFAGAACSANASVECFGSGTCNAEAACSAPGGLLSSGSGSLQASAYCQASATVTLPCYGTCYAHAQNSASGTTDPLGYGTCYAHAQNSASGYATASAAGTCYASASVSAAGQVHPSGAGACHCSAICSATGCLILSGAGTSTAEARVSGFGIIGEAPMKEVYVSLESISYGVVYQKEAFVVTLDSQGGYEIRLEVLRR